MGELEEEMKKMEEEDASEQAGLKAQIRQLETNLHAHNQLLLSCQQRMQELEATVTREKRLRGLAEAEAAALRSGRKSSTDAVPLPRRKSNGQKPQPVSQGSFGEAQAPDSYQDLPVGCGKCSQETRCECIEQAFRIGDFATNNAEPPGKRPHSPPIDADDNKRFRKDAAQESQSNEVDFTSRFLSKKPPKLTTNASSTSLSVAATNLDPCGFCQDGTPCICAEMAMEAVKRESHPDTSRISSSKNVKNASSAPSNPCINGPGTCAQCLSDANSTIFCKSLAATRPGDRPNQAPIAEPLHETSNEDLPPTPSSNTDFPASETNVTQAITGPTVTCADAYGTLSRHPAFEKASEELSTWMPQLATVPGGKERTAFEVEAASVMGVLRFFDRRFGKTAGKQGPEADE